MESYALYAANAAYDYSSIPHYHPFVRSPTASSTFSKQACCSGNTVPSDMAGPVCVFRQSDTNQAYDQKGYYNATSYAGKFEHAYDSHSPLRFDPQQAHPYPFYPFAYGTPHVPFRPATNTWTRTDPEVSVPLVGHKTSFVRKIEPDASVSHGHISRELQPGQRVWVFRRSAIPAEVVKKEAGGCIAGCYTVHFIEGGKHRYEVLCPAMGHIVPDSKEIRENLRKLGFLKEADPDVLEAAYALTSLRTPKLKIATT